MLDLVRFYAEHSLLIGGLVIGFAFGYVLQRTHFCVMGGLSDLVMFGDGRRLRAWLLAGAVAIVGAHVLEAFGVVDLSLSRYLGTRINWLPHLAGGFVFGIGMVLAGGCASRNIVRSGAGDLRALVLLLVIASFAAATISGVFGQLRVRLSTATAIDLQSFGIASQRLSDMTAPLSTAPDTTLRLTLASVVTLAVLAYVSSDRTFRTSPRHIVSGLVVGLAVTAAWALTGLVRDEFADRLIPIEALSYVAPLGAAVDWFKRSTAVGLPGLGAASVFGTLLGSFVAAKLSGTFRLQTFANVDDTLRHLGGAALMGIGGVFALGCTIGQGVSGLSTLSFGSILSVAAICAGAVTTLKIMAR